MGRRAYLGVLGIALAAGAATLGSWTPGAASPVLQNPVIFVKLPPGLLGPPLPYYIDLWDGFDGFGAPLFRQNGGNLFRLETDGRVTNLTRRLNAAVRDPEVSFDGKRVLFSMRVGVGGTWQVYEMNVDGSGERRVSPDPRFNDLDPAYLPDGRIVFVTDRLQLLDPYASLPSAQLWTMAADGTDLRQCSTNPGGDANPCVRADGRVSFIRWDVRTSTRGAQVPFDVSRFQLWDMNPDGTNDGHPIFGAHSVSIFGGGYHHARELPDGTGRFVATAARESFFNACGSLVVLDPSGDGNLHEPEFLTDARGFLTQEVANRFRDPFPLADGRLLASVSAGHTFEQFAWPPVVPSFSLAVVDPATGDAQLVYDDPNMWEWQPVEVAPRPMPPVIGDTLDLSQPWGVLNAMDVALRERTETVTAPDRQRGIPEDVTGLKVRIYKGEPLLTSAVGGATRVRAEVIGEAPVHPDGSFAARVPANTQLLWEVVNAGGKVLVKERLWNQVLPSQTQTCRGCHAPHDGSYGRRTNAALDDPAILFRHDPLPQMADTAIEAAVDVIEQSSGLVTEARDAGLRTRKQDRRLKRAARFVERAHVSMSKQRFRRARRFAEAAGRVALSARKNLRRRLER